MKLNFDDLRQAEGLLDMVMPLKDKIEARLSLENAPEGCKMPSLTGNQILRICMIAGFSMAEPRNLAEVRETQLSRQNNRFYSTFFNRNNTKALFEALIKLRYKDIVDDWEEPRIASRIIAYEAQRGFNYLMDDANLNSFLFASSSGRGLSRSIPELDLIIGHYDGEDEMEADLNLNSRSIPNAQIIIAGSTGSGKSNLISVIIQQFRNLSSETAYPVNFLLFDYKGEFSDPANRRWLTYFDTDASALLDPMDKPLPFNPFKDFRGKSQAELNIYSTELASALGALDNVVMSAKMSSRLSEAIVKAYAHNQKAPITFEKLLHAYRGLLPKAETEDCITAVLSQLVRNRLFDTEDRANWILKIVRCAN